MRTTAKATGPPHAAASGKREAAARRSAIYRLRTLAGLERAVVSCARCPRLREHCARVAAEKRAAYRRESYWGRPLPSFGDPAARIVLVGLAPGAHGANRTGRMFTGDRSGDFLFAALHRAGLCNQPTSTHRDDGLKLRDVWITAAARCAPPDNRPTPAELTSCLPYLARELSLLSRRRVLVALGAIAFDSIWAAFEEHGMQIGRPRPRFAHGAFYAIGDGWPSVLASYHPSQQNTQTGRLTSAMLDEIFTRARRLARGAVGE